MPPWQSSQYLLVPFQFAFLVLISASFSFCRCEKISSTCRVLRVWIRALHSPIECLLGLLLYPPRPSPMLSKPIRCQKVSWIINWKMRNEFRLQTSAARISNHLISRLVLLFDKLLFFFIADIVVAHRRRDWRAISRKTFPKHDAYLFIYWQLWTNNEIFV